MINISDVQKLAGGSDKPEGIGGQKLLDRAKRFTVLRGELKWNGDDSLSLLQEIFDVNRWDVGDSSEFETAKLDMELLFIKASDICRELEVNIPDSTAEEKLREVARRLRHQIATREPFVADESSDLQITTLWGAKGITADHVYVIGLCDEAIPGIRREEYPGTDNEYNEEQRRLFYVSITRSKKTLVLSRAKSIGSGQAKQLGLQLKNWQRLSI